MSSTTQDITSILQQVKGLEEEKARLLRLLEEEKARCQEAQAKAERMSEGKRAEMRAALQGVIQKWLEDSVQDEKLREEFRQGMCRLVDSTAEDSGVWQVVCQASNVHAHHLQRLEEMRMENETLKTQVRGEFHDEAARKRPREEEGQPSSSNIWSEFEAQLRTDRTIGAGL